MGIRLERVRTRAVLVLAVLVSVPLSAYAGRSIIAPPYQRRMAFDFGMFPNPASPNPVPSGTAIGAALKVFITMTNISNIPQTGHFGLLPGSDVSALQAGRSPASAHMMACGDSGASGTSMVPFTLDANQTKTYSVDALFTSTFNPTGPGGMSAMDAYFSPIIKIMVDQDRGAILITMTPQWDVPGPGDPPACDGTAIGYLSGNAYISENRTGVPLLVNGGRPF